MTDEKPKAPKDSEEIKTEQEETEAGSIKDEFDKVRPYGGGGSSKKDPRRPVS